MSPFDPAARALARARARRIGAPFLLDRLFEDCVERLDLIARPKARLLLVGPLSPQWATQLPGKVETIDCEPAALASLEPAAFDAAVAIGGLDTMSALPEALFALGAALKPDRPLLGALLGGPSLPRLRASAMAADQARFGGARPRMHPRLDGPTLAGLLQQAGLTMPVVDVGGFSVRYSSLGRLVGDLRAAAATSQLAERPRASAGKAWRNALEAAFLADPVERFSPLNFLAWSRT